MPGVRGVPVRLDVHQDIKQLLHDQNDTQDAEVAIQELLQRKKDSTERED